MFMFRDGGDIVTRVPQRQAFVRDTARHTVPHMVDLRQIGQRASVRSSSGAIASDIAFVAYWLPAQAQMLS